VSADEQSGHVSALLALGVCGLRPEERAARRHRVGGAARARRRTYVPPRLMAPAVREPSLPDLTPRQEEVLRLLARGLPNKSIATRSA
jgi:DNA-binding NarL/FixJ family response regulator